MIHCCMWAVPLCTQVHWYLSRLCSVHKHVIWDSKSCLNLKATLYTRHFVDMYGEVCIPNKHDIWDILVIVYVKLKLNSHWLTLY